MLENIQAEAVHELVSKGGAIIVDIRETDEYAAKHIQGAYLMPLSVIQCLPAAAMLPDTKVFFMCHSGGRTLASLVILEGLHANAAVLDGGIVAWEKAGLPLKRIAHGMSIGRQVLLTVGILLILAWFGTFAGLPIVGWVPLFLGAGLTFAGLSGFCGLGLLLNAMPWNKNKQACS